MYAIPSSLPRYPDEVVTGMSCPDCFGVLNASVEGKNEALHFRCRIGHSYSVEEVIIGKEKVVEESMWTAVTALDELATFLRELATRCADANVAAAYEQRAARADEQGRTLRECVEDGTPAPWRRPTGHDETEQ